MIILAAILSCSTAMFAFPMQTNVYADSMISLKFDFGGLGTAEGYTGISASDKYSAAKGFGFANTAAVEDVPASGKGALADAVRFRSDVPNHIFNTDLPKGVYKITVTTGSDGLHLNAPGADKMAENGHSAAFPPCRAAYRRKRMGFQHRTDRDL